MRAFLAFAVVISAANESSLWNKSAFEMISIKYHLSFQMNKLFKFLFK